MSLKSKLSLSAVIATVLVMFPALALAQEGAASNKYDANSWAAVAAGLAIGIAARFSSPPPRSRASPATRAPLPASRPR
jgi:hypothetical protein